MVMSGFVLGRCNAITWCYATVAALSKIGARTYKKGEGFEFGFNMCFVFGPGMFSFRDI